MNRGTTGEYRGSTEKVDTWNIQSHRFFFLAPRVPPPRPRPNPPLLVPLPPLPRVPLEATEGAL